MQLIYPERRTTSPEELAADLRLHELAPADRPYLGINMVSSLDGKATLDWRTKGLSTEIDRRLFHHLRTQADAVMVGAGTVREERYGRMTKNDELRDKRVAEGRAAGGARRRGERAPRPAGRPAAAERARAAGADRDRRGALAGRTPRAVEYARVGDDLPRLMAELHERGVRSVLCEGGPTLNSFLFAAGLVDELFLTMNPKVVGGAAALTIVAGRELVEPAELDLVSVAEAEGELLHPLAGAASSVAPVAGRRPCPLVIRVHGNRQDRACRVAAAAAARTTPVVEFKDVTKVYDGGSVAVQAASMRIGRGEFVFLVGPTGCGKSTCIRLLMKELEPSRGEISIAGHPLARRCRAHGCRTCAATSASSSRTTSCCRTGRCTTTSPTRSR